MGKFIFNDYEVVYTKRKLIIFNYPNPNGNPIFNDFPSVTKRSDLTTERSNKRVKGVENLHCELFRQLQQ
jgi:hypothetical protein